MRQDELHPARGSKKMRKRVGRGDGSGHGSYSGRGVKGQKARAGGNVRRGFEGGQLPIIESLPRKRGFTNIFKTEYSVVNVAKLNIFGPGTEVTPQQLLEVGVVKSLKRPIKILGEGTIDRALIVKANKFSKSAKEKIEAIGGEAKEIENAAEAI